MVDDPVVGVPCRVVHKRTTMAQAARVPRAQERTQDSPVAKTTFLETRRCSTMEN